jgi:hypothetical protein
VTGRNKAGTVFYLGDYDLKAWGEVQGSDILELALPCPKASFFED